MTDDGLVFRWFNERNQADDGYD